MMHGLKADRNEEVSGNLLKGGKVCTNVPIVVEICDMIFHRK